MGASRGGRKERAGIVYRLTLQTKHESPFEAAPVPTVSCTEEWITLTLRTDGSLECSGSTVASSCIREPLTSRNALANWEQLNSTVSLGRKRHSIYWVIGGDFRILRSMGQVLDYAEQLSVRITFAF